MSQKNETIVLVLMLTTAAIASGGFWLFTRRGVDLGDVFKSQPDESSALRKVANTLGSIYYASAPEVVPQCSVKPLPVGRNSQELIPPYQEPFISLSQCSPKCNQLNAAAFQSG